MIARVLIVEDDRELLELLRAMLEGSDFEVATTDDPEEALAAAVEGCVDVIVTDIMLGEADGLALCERVCASTPDVPVVVMTGHGSMKMAVAAIRAGAYDFITKPVSRETLLRATDRALERRRLVDEVERLRRQLSVSADSELLIGESTEMSNLRGLIGRVAVTDATVLITGESGTGKELVARAIHDVSDRRDKPFVAVNCAAMPESLLESELFGHVRGAFTDAKSSREGLFVQADGGTLFLDEIGEMPAGMQAKMLRVLQENSVRPVGANSEVSFDTRIVCATNRCLDQRVRQGEFREDLYYRVRVVELPVPPLRDRGNDSLILAHTFVERVAARQKREVAGISPEAAAMIRDYAWPGNVRELQNAVERAVALTRFAAITPEDLPPEVRQAQPKSWSLATDATDTLIPLKTLEERYVNHVLSTVDGNKTRAAEILGLDRRTLYRKLARYDHPEGNA